MNSRGLTLVETLAACTLAALLVSTGASWMSWLRRNTAAIHAHSRDKAALLLVASRLREDLMLATTDLPIGSRDDHGAWQIIVAGNDGSLRQRVTWIVRKGAAIRRSARLDGSNSSMERIGQGITALSITNPDADVFGIVVNSADSTLDIHLRPGTSHVP